MILLAEPLEAANTFVDNGKREVVLTPSFSARAGLQMSICAPVSRVAQNNKWLETQFFQAKVAARTRKCYVNF